VVLLGGLRLIVFLRPAVEGQPRPPITYASGRFEEDEHNGIRVYDTNNTLIREYGSGEISAWQVADANNEIIERSSYPL